MTPRTLWGMRLLTLGYVLGVIGVCTIAGATCAYLAGCGAAPTPQQQVQEADWTALDAFCIKTNATRPNIDACRDGLRTAFCAPDGGIFADAGACVNVTLSNGMRP